MLKQIAKILSDFFFPLHCLSCGQEGDLACPKCRQNLDLPIGDEQLRHENIFVITTYQDPLAKQLIQVLKYYHLKVAAKTIAEITQSRQKMLGLNLDQEQWLLIPAPLSTWRRLNRGYNQSELIAKQLAKLDPGHFQVADRLVKKIKDTPSQVSIKNRADRLKNLQAVFQLDQQKSSQLRNQAVIILDDVSTTGTTLRELKKVIQAAGPRKIIGLVFAHG